MTEQSYEWAEGRLYMTLELLAESKVRIVSIESHSTASEPTVTTHH